MTTKLKASSVAGEVSVTQEEADRRVARWSRAERSAARRQMEADFVARLAVTAKRGRRELDEAARKLVESGKYEEATGWLRPLDRTPVAAAAAEEQTTQGWLRPLDATQLGSAGGTSGRGGGDGGGGRTGAGGESGGGGRADGAV